MLRHSAPEPTITIARDNFGKPTSITRSGSYAGVTLSATRSYVYDANHRLCKTIEPEIGATILNLDAADNVTWRAPGLALPNPTTCDQTSVAAASKISQTFDKLNREMVTTFGDGSPLISRSYTPDGQPLAINSAGANWTYGYNNRRILTSESLVYGGVTYPIGWGINSYGHVATMQYPDGANFQLTVDALGRPTTMGSYATGITYFPDDAVSGYTLANHIVHSMTENVRGLPLVNTDAGVLSDQYAYDQNGNVLSITDLLDGTSTRSMLYDAMDRLTTADDTGVWGHAAYTYDPLDNLRTSVVGTRSSTHNYDGQNRLSSIVTGGVSSGYGYDARGNITTRGAETFTFDLGNRLAKANGSTTYTYDGLGRRVNIADASGNTVQVYDRNGQLVFASKTAAGVTTKTRYMYVAGKAVAAAISATGGTWFNYNNDALGSPVAHTNGSGVITMRTRYEPYGKTAAGTDPTDLGFTGHVNDSATGLVYMQQRYYDPLAGRFLSLDPVGTDLDSGAGFNRFVYAQNSPYRFVDPDGRQIMLPWSTSVMYQGTSLSSAAAAVGKTQDAGQALGRAVDAAGTAGGDALRKSGEKLGGEFYDALNPESQSETTTEKSGSRTLAKNIELQTGVQKVTGDSTHHIVAENDKRALPARLVLQNAKMDINDAFNGVNVPGNYHGGIHTNVYYIAVNNALAGASDYRSVAGRLLVIGAQIKSGTFPY